MQKKIGFDKFPVPSVLTVVPLKATTGENLTDRAGQPLVTETEISVSSIANKDSATSIVVDSPNMTPLKVADIFQETSEVSTTLLGVSRQEEQLSLFADVSTLGLNPDEWEVFNFTGGNHYGPWDNRATNIGFNHYNATMDEQTEEQALRVGAFPVPYDYPFGPNFEDQGLYNAIQYDEYKSFIDAGNNLWTHYQDTIAYPAEYGWQTWAEEKFLNPNSVRLDGSEVYFDGITDAQAYALIDNWTRTWQDIRSNRLVDIAAVPVSAATGAYSKAGYNLENETRPGYSSSNVRFSFLQSKKAYRYQPGRISGFTFGARAFVDQTNTDNIVEWGIANPTDQYIFRVSGRQFSIVRRSTVRLDDSVVLAQGLPVTAQVRAPSGDPFDFQEGIPGREPPRDAEGSRIINQYETLVIPSDKFNGDQLNGNGPSGYVLRPDLVTMYKIEFGWYGAIGARFFAYIPVGNGEARWVLLHTLVIENKLGEPCLEDPYFRFRYTCNIANTQYIREPQYLYKYGASCYIDGGDTGTVTQRSYSSGARNVASDIERGILGLYPKEFITNAQGYRKKNKKIIYPITATFTSDVLTKIKTLKCTGCREYGFNYNQGLSKGSTGRVITDFALNPSRNNISTTVSSQEFTLDDIGAKIVSDGLYSGYIKSLADPINNGGTTVYETAVIERIVSGYNKVSTGYPAQSYSRTTGTVDTIEIEDVYPYDATLSQYDIVGSDVQLTGSRIEINFLNPLKRTNGIYNDFFVGVTDRKPVTATDSDLNNVVVWEFGGQTESLTIDKVLFADWTQSTTSRNRDGFETGETAYTLNEKLEVDYRLPSPAEHTVDANGDPLAESLDSTGVCSRAVVEILDRTSVPVTMVLNNPETGEVDGNYYLKSTNVFPADGLNGGEIGQLVDNELVATGVKFSTNQLGPYIDGTDTIYYVRIDGIIPDRTVGSTFSIYLTPVRIYDDHLHNEFIKIFQFNPHPLYLVVGLRDNSRVNSISIKEYIGDNSYASSPSWIVNDDVTIENYQGYAEQDLPPVSFFTADRLDSGSVDTQLVARLRPSQTVDTFFVGANESKTIHLNSIYGPDRETITPDLFGIQATFFTGQTVIANTQGVLQMSINTAEQ